MINTGIVINRWKLSVYKKHLDAANYEVTAITKVGDAAKGEDWLMLSLRVMSINSLAEVVFAASEEADAIGSPK